MAIFGLIYAVFNLNKGDESKACPEDAKICPDGSVVVRIQPNCEFAICPPNDQSGTNNGSGTGNGTQTSVKIALLDTDGSSDGKPRGCDKVVLIQRSVKPTTQPLNAALKELFEENETRVDGYMNFMAKTNDTLKFDRATVSEGTARVYLTGRLSGLGGVCDDPRAQIQIEETALQFSTVNKVIIYLNGAETTLTPDLRG